MHASPDENLIKIFSEIFVKISESAPAVQFSGTSRYCRKVTVPEEYFGSNSVQYRNGVRNDHVVPSIIELDAPCSLVTISECCS